MPFRRRIWRLLNASMKVLERVTLKAAAYKPEHAN